MTIARYIIHIALLALATAAVAQEAAQEPPGSVRQHYQIVLDGAVVCDVTEISRSSEERSENYVLVRDADHGEYVVRKIWTYKDQQSVYRLSDMRDRVFVQAVAKMPFTGKTRTATSQEARENPETVMRPVTLELETNGAAWDGVSTEWDDPVAKRHFRYTLRRALDPFLLEAIERMRGIPFKEGAMDVFYASIAQLVLYVDDAEELRASKLRQKDAAPDCAFDARFGFPCSAKQLARVKKSLAEGKPLTHY
jgi:hypothetical protein